MSASHRMISLAAVRPGIPHAAVWAGQVEMQRRALAQTWRDLAAVDLGHLAVLVEDRDHHAAVEVLVAALA